MKFIFSFTTLLFVFLHFGVKSQNYGDKNFYLIDSLDLNQVSQRDKILIDSSLKIYHSTLVDTLEFEILQHLVDECWDNDIWPRYNQFLIERIKLKLNRNNSEADLNKSLYYLAGAISNLGFYQDQKGDLLMAIDRYHQGLMIYEHVDDKSGMATTLNNLGVIYSTIGDTSKALEYHRRCLDLKRDIKDLKGVSVSYNNIGSVYENFNQPFKALEYYRAALKVSADINDNRGIAMSNDNVGDIYYQQGYYSKAESYYTTSLKYWNLVGGQEGISTALNNLANVKLAVGDIEASKNYATESYRLAQSVGFPVDIQNSAKTLSNIARMEGDFELALKYMDVYNEMRDLLNNDRNSNFALRKSMQYEYQKETLKDSLEFQKEREISAIKLQKKESQSYALILGLFLFLILFLFGIRSYRRKQRDNYMIKKQKAEVEFQKQEIERQHVELATTHKEISDSITYAKRIQQAILPTKELINKFLKDGFVYFNPKEQVSGDFYWLEKVNHQGNDILLIAVADCTGHGVPGAMVSVVCHNALNRAVREFGLIEPAGILDKTRELVIETFNTNKFSMKDGMDIALVAIQHMPDKRVHLTYAGANNPLYILRQSSESELEILKANKQPVGIFETAREFTNQKTWLHPGDTFYLFSDGFMDQFGGPNGKKFKYSRFRQLLLDARSVAMRDQESIFRNTFEQWKGQLEQIDDVCVIGVEI